MVGLLAGALGSGIGQAAGSVADIAKGYIDNERKVDLQRQFADIELEKQNRLDEARKAREYEYKLKENDPNGQFVNNEIASKKKGITELYNDKSVLTALTNKDMAETAGARATKAMRSGDSLAAESGGGMKLPEGVKTQISVIDSELNKVNEQLYKSYADPNADKAGIKTLEDKASQLHLARTKVLSNAGVYKSGADVDMNQFYKKQDTEKPAQEVKPANPAQPETKPKAPRTYESIQKDFAGWTAKKSGDDFIVFDPNGNRQWGSDFTKQYGVLPQVLPSK